jgi:hypothetical protein
MKRAFLIALLFAFVVASSGCCVSTEVKDEIHLNYLRVKKYAALMDDDKTTPEQDKKMIRANVKAWAALDFKINDNEEAKADAEGREP